MFCEIFCQQVPILLYFPLTNQRFNDIPIFLLNNPDLFTTCDKKSYENIVGKGRKQ